MQCLCALPGAKAAPLLQGWVLQLQSCEFIPSRGSKGNRNNPKATHAMGSGYTGNWQHHRGTGKNPINLSPARDPAPIPTQARAMGSFGFFCKRSSSKVLALFAPHPHRAADREHEKPRALPALQQENTPGRSLWGNKLERTWIMSCSTSPVPLWFSKTRKVLAPAPPAENCCSFESSVGITRGWNPTMVWV